MQQNKLVSQNHTRIHLGSLQIMCLCPIHSGSGQSSPFEELLAAMGMTWQGYYRCCLHWLHQNWSERRAKNNIKGFSWWKRRFQSSHDYITWFIDLIGWRQCRLRQLQFPMMVLCNKPSGAVWFHCSTDWWRLWVEIIGESSFLWTATHLLILETLLINFPSVIIPSPDFIGQRGKTFAFMVDE